MNPVCSYNSFLEFLQYSHGNNDKLIPIFLIKPATMIYLNERLHLDNHFNYFDRRAGRNVDFFLPGYAHYPSITFNQIFPNFNYSKDAIALDTERLGRIYYNNADFIEFIEILERNSFNFIYRGDTELLFIKYLSNNQHAKGTFDFTTIYRFNLSDLFYCSNAKHEPDHIRFGRVSRFLEDVIRELQNLDNN
ncbi:MAG: hypothetical protein IKB73_00535, partial [Ruminococcus sp.]|nr:hypothetical protein [Ruminococcus sp.]